MRPSNNWKPSNRNFVNCINKHPNIPAFSTFKFAAHLITTSPGSSSNELIRIISRLTDLQVNLNRIRWIRWTYGLISKCPMLTAIDRSRESAKSEHFDSEILGIPTWNPDVWFLTFKFRNFRFRTIAFQSSGSPEIIEFQTFKLATCN